MMSGRLFHRQRRGLAAQRHAHGTSGMLAVSAVRERRRVRMRFPVLLTTLRYVRSTEAPRLGENRRRCALEAMR